MTQPLPQGIPARFKHYRLVRQLGQGGMGSVFEGIDDPRWDGGDATHPLMTSSERFEPMRKIRTPGERIV